MNKRIVTIGHTIAGDYFFGIQPPMSWTELKKIPNPASKENNFLTTHFIAHDSMRQQVVAFGEGIPADHEQAQEFAVSLAKSIGAQALLQVKTISHENELLQD